MLRGLGETDKLNELRNDVTAGLGRTPTGTAVRSFWLCSMPSKARNSSAREALDAVLVDNVTKSMASDVCRSIAQELEAYEPCRDIVIAFTSNRSRPQHGNERIPVHSGTPTGEELSGKRAAQAEPRQNARERPSGNRELATQLRSGFAIYQRVQNYSELSQKMAELKFPVDALRLYREALMAADSPWPAHRGTTRRWITTCWRPSRRSARRQTKSQTTNWQARPTNCLLRPFVAMRKRPST